MMRGEGFCAAHDRFARIAGAHEDWIVELNRRRKYNQIGVAGSGCAMLVMKTQTALLQSVRFHCADFVGASDDSVPKLEQERGDTAPSRSRPRR